MWRYFGDDVKPHPFPRMQLQARGRNGALTPFLAGPLHHPNAPLPSADASVFNAAANESCIGIPGTWFITALTAPHPPLKKDVAPRGNTQHPSSGIVTERRLRCLLRLKAWCPSELHGELPFPPCKNAAVKSLAISPDPSRYGHFVVKRFSLTREIFMSGCLLLCNNR